MKLKYKEIERKALLVGLVIGIVFGFIWGNLMRDTSNYERGRLDMFRYCINNPEKIK